MKFPHATLLTFVCAGAFAAQLRAQQPLGDWVHPQAQALDVFVSPAPLGNDANDGLTPATPLASLDRAIALADGLVASAPTPKGATVNVLPGTYSLQSPLSLPAFGVSIERYWAKPNAAPVHITMGFSAPFSRGMINFDSILGPKMLSHGLTSSVLPPSSLRGLRLTTVGSSPVVSINPTASISGASAGDVLEVLITQCDLGDPITRCVRGIEDHGAAGSGLRCENRFIDNDIHDMIGQAIFIRPNATTCSPLIQSNRIRGCAMGVYADGSNSMVEGCHPRIDSNFIFDCPNGDGVLLRQSAAHVVNNTIAFVTPGGVVTSSAGILCDSAVDSSNIPAIVIANNILFNPGLPELLFIGQPVAAPPTVQSNDATAALPFGSGTNILASSPFVSSTPPFDLHLASASPNLGNPAFVLPPASFTLAGVSFLANVNLDVDLDSRMHQPAGAAAAVLHRGADQRLAGDIRLRKLTNAVSNALLADTAGNIVPGANGTSSVALAIDAPPGSFFMLFFGATLPSGPVFQQALVAPFGSLALDTNSTNTVSIASGPIPGVSVNVTPNFGAVAGNFLEAEFYLQALVLRPDGTGSFTNRVRIDIDRN